jgi:hypothetical protein
MEQELVKRIKTVKVEIGELLKEIAPANEAEWTAFEKLNNAHAALRKIEFDKLGQLSFPTPTNIATAPLPEDPENQAGDPMASQGKGPDFPTKASKRQRPSALLPKAE